ncbi:DinB family protein [Neobacillus sp. M.A.Huq-85]|nr:DinB family protein [Neobacillus cucumis]
MLLSMETKLQYHHWANRTLLEHINQLDEEVFIKEVNSIFPSLAAIFEHIYSVDSMWLKRISGEKTPVLEAIKFDIPSMAIQAFDQLHHQFNQLYIIEGKISYQNSKGEFFQNELYEIIEHLSNHGTYHRGNASAVLHQLGHNSVSTDLIFFLRMVNK